MEIKTFRAGSMQEALHQVRQSLGPNAAVLQAREVQTGFFRRLSRTRQIEVVASADLPVPSRLPAGADSDEPWADSLGTTRGFTDESLFATSEPQAPQQEFRDRFQLAADGDFAEGPSLVEELSRQDNGPRGDELPRELQTLRRELIARDLNEELAGELIERIRSESPLPVWGDTATLKSQLAESIRREIAVSGPIHVPASGSRVVALVGPTGVGKTTTIAKLAASYRLKHQRRVGLITVDTYRIAAVEQLRTYAEIIDLPIEVVSTPCEMRQAIDRLCGLELVFIDTAGRSPSDAVKMQELKSMLAEARPDEVHLVLSMVAAVDSLETAAERFAGVGVTSLVLSKLDETTGLGNLLPLIRACRLPLSYVTNGQKVPDDIELADGGKLANGILGIEPRL